MGCKIVATMRWSIPILALLAVSLSGCGSSGSAEPKDTGASPAVGSAKAPTGKIEVQSFKGGYGIDFFQTAAKEYAEKHPGTEVKVDGNPRVWEQLKPRFVSGKVPDLTFPGWGMDHWGLAEEEQLMALEDVLKTPAADGKTPWGETFDPALLKLGQLDGKQWTLPYYVIMYGWWYDPELFKENGWTVPKTFNELLAVSEKIKAKGMAPITFQGQYPFYMLCMMMLPWVVSEGGQPALTACQNLEPGAWKSPSMLKAAQMIAQLRDKGFFESGAVGMSHTQSQAGFLNRKAAFVPCGTWIHPEMKDSWPKDRKIAFMLPPTVDGGKGDPTAIQVAIEPWMVPTKAANPELAIDFFKYMTSPAKAKQFVEEKGTLMAIKGAADGAKLPEYVVEPARIYGESKDIWSVQFRSWYPAMFKELENATTALVSGKATPEEFCERAEKAAQATRDDESITKHKL